jgi:hypothetical protein
MEYVVSPDGLPENSGTEASPWSLNHGVAQLQPGDVLYLLDGVYYQRLSLLNLKASATSPIVVRSFPGSHAVIDAGFPEFQEVPNTLWDGPDAVGEYVTHDAFPHDNNNRAAGSFLERVPYTRLVRYSTHQDLQATNELFGPIRDVTIDPLDGPEAVSCANAEVLQTPAFPRRPWVYMGPGLWQDDTGRIHVRLSATHNNVAGFEDYTGLTDPGQVPLAIWTFMQATLRIVNCASVYVEDLTVRHGSTVVHVEKSSDIRLDHLVILAGPYGVEIGESCHGTVLTHSLIDGGMPPWYFRSDRKDGYCFVSDGAVVNNGLGESTCRALLFGVRDCTETTISYCEFVNGHDLSLFGSRLAFTRNLVSNLDDDALIAETEGLTDLRIFENVIEQALTGISFGTQNFAGNGVSVYRNLFDLRRPTLGIRPRPDVGEPRPDPLRLGQLFKGNTPDGPLDLFHNTILVRDHDGAAAVNHFRAYKGESRRRAYNNVFVDISTVEQADKPISYLPAPTWPAATDGNCFFRTGPFAGTWLFHYDTYAFPGVPSGQVPGDDFFSIDELLHDTHPSPRGRFFTDSQDVHPPGFEASSIDEDPRFREFDATHPDPLTDDFRLRADSPARHHGVVLPADLRCLDGTDSSEIPDIGCFRMSDPPLEVGVDARRRFPPG